MSTKRKTREQFIKEAKEIHGDKYDYSKVEYVNNITEVCIICPNHGEFWQKPKNHLNGKGCKKCGWERFITSLKTNDRTQYPKKRKTYPTEFLIKLIKEKYDGKYTLVKDAKRVADKITLFCHELDENGTPHGEFQVIKQEFIKNGCGCRKCRYIHLRNLFRSNTEEFISKAREIHGDKYDYSKVEYVNNTTKVCITCKEKDEFGNQHGDFWITPANHLKHRGCPICKTEKLVYENNLYHILLELFDKDEIIRQYRNEKMLGRQSFDFFIPNYNLAIEHQGSQHFKPINKFGGVEKYEKLCALDKQKYRICEENNLEILYFSYEKYTIPQDYFVKVFSDIKEFKEEIINIKNKKQWEK